MHQEKPVDPGSALSFAQERLWFLDMLRPGGTEYLLPLALRVRGVVDADALGRAVDELVARHEVLRTRYGSVAGAPVQLVDPPRPGLLTTVRRPHVEPHRRDADAVDFTRQQLRVPVELTGQWPMRVHLVAYAPDDFLLVVVVHHIAFDGWSWGVLGAELTELYQAATAGRPHRLPEPPVQYADFALWQRESLTDGLAGEQRDYWRGALAGLPALDFPTDRPHPAVPQASGAAVPVTVPADVAEPLAAIGRAAQATPFMVCLAAFAVLLGRYVRHTDVVVGTPVAGRSHADLEGLLGLFVNTLVLRTDLAGDPTFRQLVRRVRDVTLSASGHADLPFDHLVNELQPDRDLSRNPLAQVVFSFHDTPVATFAPAGLDVTEIDVDVNSSTFDFGLQLEQRRDGSLGGLLHYSTALFDAATMHRLAAQLGVLLRGVTADPDAPLSRLPILPEDELATVCGRFSGPDRPAPAAGPTMPELVQRHAAAAPDAVAVIAADRQLDYATLNTEANRLARHLRAAGVRPETSVGVCLQRGSDAVVAMLAVLKSGGVYVPLDAGHPADRLAFITRDADIRVLVTTQAAAASFPAGPYRTVLVDRDAGLIRAQPAADPQRWHDRDNAAYLIYTSGSTGRPKGVLIEHASYAEHCRVITDAYRITARDTVLSLAATAFDGSLEQVGASLTRGATVVLSDPLFWSPAELPARIARHRVTSMNITPHYYREVLDALPPGDDRLATLTMMNVGADVVTVDDVRRWRATGLPGRFVGCYGPTEATISSLLQWDHAGLDVDGPHAVLPIGRPVAGTSVYVLDDNLLPVPIGAPGELCLGGVRVGRGYRGRPDLTADRFVPDPYGGTPGRRLYRTGDLARFRADGAVEFLGRIDQQVKIRGYRIELGEIEAVLGGHPAVRAVAVVARPMPDLRLVAYVVPHDGLDLDVTGLRAALAERLPEYMIPAHWVRLGELPLTASKKVDRAALPQPDPLAATPGTGHAEPATPTERTVAAIWRDVLKIDTVGLHDDFFLLGGHSLTATRVLARLRPAFDTDIPLRQLFVARTVAALAALIDQREKPGDA